MAMKAAKDDERLMISSPPPAAAQEHPWLLIHHGRHRQLQTFYNVSEDRCYVRKIPQLCNNYVCFSHPSGWLVMEHLESDECFLFNLVSMKKIPLPIRESNYRICVLTSPPTDDNNCHVVFINRSNTCIVFCQPGDSEFVEQSMGREGGLLCATAFQGKFNALRIDNMALVVLDFTTPNPQFIQIISGEAIGNPSPPDIIKTSTYIIESCGELLPVLKMWHGLSFHEVFGFLVFCADFSTKTWVEVKSLGEKNAIYLDSHDGMCISATKDGRIRGNSIYFTEDKDRCLYIFDLANQRISFSLPCATSMDDEKACSAPRKTKKVVSFIASQDLDTTVPERSWSDLGPEMLSLIISNLFLRDSNNFNATCKSWKSIFPPFPPPSASTLSKLPYLMILNGSDSKFFQPLRNEMYQKEISELKNARIRFCKYSWLLMSEGESSMFFFQPFTMVKIKLPDLPRRHCFKNLSFLSLPTSSDCMVIGFEFRCSIDIDFGIIKHGEDKWTFQRIRHKKHFIISDASPVHYNGKLYCLGETGNVGVLDFKNKGFWDVCSNPLTKWSCYKNRQSFTVKCDGGMLVIFVIHEDRRIEVKKLNLPQLVWEDVESFGNKMLYVSHEACLLEKAVEEGMGNKIYFPKFHGESCVFYSLDTRMYHSILGNYASRTSFNLDDQLFCTWIKATNGCKFFSPDIVIKNLGKGWLDL